MKVSIHVSSLTGNTRRLAERLESDLNDCGYEVTLHKIGEPFSEDSDVIILAYWCRKSSLDDKSLKCLSAVEGRRVIAVGTIGGRADDSYGRRVEENAFSAVNEKNECLGSVVVQGSVAMKGIERRRTLPESNPRYVDERKYERLLSNQGRPNEEDMLKATDYVKSCLAAYSKDMVRQKCFDPSI